MSWKNGQKALFVQACASIGWGESQRHMLLSSIPHAVGGKGHPTSTSPRLNNSDFEYAMSVVESHAPGQRIVLKHRRWGALHFAKKAADDLSQTRRKVGAIAKRLEASGNLEPGGAGLAGWISNRVTRGSTDRLDQLDYHELYKLIEGLKAFARRNGVRID